MSRALLIVDVQPTFCEGGALAVEGGNAVAERVARFSSKNADAYDIIVSTQDWHIDPGTHFSTEPDYVDTWPPHGIANTEEAELHPALDTVEIDYFVKKGEYDDGYSGFDGRSPDGSTLAELLEEEGITRVDVVGLALSHCVKETALDATKLDHIDQVRVFLDLTEPVSPEQGEKAKELLQEANVQLLQSANFG